MANDKDLGASKLARDPFYEEDFYVPSEADIEKLPDPTDLLRVIAASVVEVISGVRSVDQLASLVSDSVYEKLRARAVLRARATAATGKPRLVPKFSVTRVRLESPKPGVIESVVLLSSHKRTRAVTIRLEPGHQGWKATSVSVL
jgi:hypothetical protein